MDDDKERGLLLRRDLRQQASAEDAGQVERVIWEFWRVTQSQYRYRGSCDVVDLGNLGELE